MGTGRRPDKTRAWTAAKLLILAGFVALGIGAYVAWKPVVNPHVQDCGSPIGFFVTSRENVLIHPGEPDAPPNAVALASQPPCRDLAYVEIEKAGLAVAAFFGLTLLGIVVGLLDDRIGYWSAPRYETLLRDMPRQSRIEHGLVPNVDVDELGVDLPPLETTEVWALIVFGLLTFAALPFAGPLEATRAAASQATLLPVLVGLVVVIGSFLAAALQRKAVYPRGESWVATIEVVVATSWVGRLRPLVTSFGIDVHHLRKSGLDRDEALLDVRVLESVSALVHVVLLGVSTLLVLGSTFPAVHLDTPQLVLAGLLALLLLSGLNRLTRRARALPVRPGWAGIRGIPRVAAAPPQLAELVGGTLLVTAAGLVVLALAAGTFGVSLPLGQLLFVSLVATTVGAVSPTPYGVGVFEATMVLLLIVAGVDPGAAVCTTLTFRTLTFWLPMLPAWRAARSLRATAHL